MSGNKDPLGIVLDLDETLIHTAKESISNIRDRFDIPIDDQGQSLSCYIRPGARNLLSYLIENPDLYRIGIFTAATEDYAEEVIGNLVPKGKRDRVEFVLHRGNIRMSTPDIDLMVHSSMPEPKKDIKKVLKRFKDLHKSRVIVVDDKPRQWSRSYGNVLPVKVFSGQTNDNQMMGVLSALRFLSGLDDVRGVEKRGMVSRHAKQCVGLSEPSSVLFEP